MWSRDKYFVSYVSSVKHWDGEGRGREKEVTFYSRRRTWMLTERNVSCSNGHVLARRFTRQPPRVRRVGTSVARRNFRLRQLLADKNRSPRTREKTRRAARFPVLKISRSKLWRLRARSIDRCYRIKCSERRKNDYMFHLTTGALCSFTGFFYFNRVSAI